MTTRFFDAEGAESPPPPTWVPISEEWPMVVVTAQPGFSVSERHVCVEASEPCGQRGLSWEGKACGVNSGMAAV